MNLFETLKARLEENGLFENQANEIMKTATLDTEAFANIHGRWADDAAGYPPMMINVLFAILRPIAYKWICENAPKAWFRPVFSPGVIGLKGEELNEFIKNYQRDEQGYPDLGEDKKG